MGNLLSKARKGRLAALQGRSRSMLFPEVEREREPAHRTVVALPARRVVTVFG